MEVDKNNNLSDDNIFKNIKNDKKIQTQFYLDCITLLVNYKRQLGLLHYYKKKYENKIKRIKNLKIQTGFINNINFIKYYLIIYILLLLLLLRNFN